MPSGKSTLAGHLLYKCGQVDLRKINRNRHYCRDLNMDTHEYAYALHKHKIEKETGHTYNANTHELKSK